LAKKTIVGMGILGPGSFAIPCELTCEMCKGSSSIKGDLKVELAAGEETDFAIKSICLKCGHQFINPLLR
jgi:hypothetical protein